MSEAVFRIERIAARDVDRALCALGEFSLERDARATLLVLPARLASRAVALLGRCGVSATPSERTPRPERAIAAHVAHLAPIRLEGIHDHLWIGPADLGRATGIAHGGIFRRYDADRLRAFLRDEDRAYRWRRVVWVPRAALRGRSLHGVKPIVFDRESITTGHERWGFTRAAQLTEWIAG